MKASVSGFPGLSMIYGSQAHICGLHNNVNIIKTHGTAAAAECKMFSL